MQNGRNLATIENRKRYLAVFTKQRGNKYSQLLKISHGLGRPRTHSLAKSFGLLLIGLQLFVMLLFEL